MDLSMEAIDVHSFFPGKVKPRKEPIIIEWQKTEEIGMSRGTWVQFPGEHDEVELPASQPSPSSTGRAVYVRGDLMLKFLKPKSSDEGSSKDSKSGASTAERVGERYLCDVLWSRSQPPILSNRMLRPRQLIGVATYVRQRWRLEGPKAGALRPTLAALLPARTWCLCDTTWRQLCREAPQPRRGAETRRTRTHKTGRRGMPLVDAVGNIQWNTTVDEDVEFDDDDCDVTASFTLPAAVSDTPSSSSYSKDYEIFGEEEAIAFCEFQRFVRDQNDARSQQEEAWRVAAEATPSATHAQTLAHAEA
ncbi:unnamed protein product [Caenorhabditis auriculariae]|uniref:Uncharacterized protein n=1 Tax=Caenorhabditis auriculariae TaxID=2777116 RepID=A0A8S1HDF3_9PELO|nr:unnamed protein product [Caenorhabditis auriculariae]